ncbi:MULTISPECIES: hypothetical protein [Paraburkholderia]|uniref:hypothetical protein n=1 Tax=Paraburkholderia TaxID=1822464 RepID=UPI0022558570|nr:MULTISPECIES: hypothetical protein [Paraburkholderia]MCX4162620.1 hypothetical protein [Paraburkholderia megapolitana]MDN7158115.1 hypothetical protein [Paraburkholderia sp. CHISQ3]MDQ6495162.1 hypothetical protein [Paraburkholderia megapolitana]
MKSCRESVRSNGTDHGAQRNCVLLTGWLAAALEAAHGAEAAAAAEAEVGGVTIGCGSLLPPAPAAASLPRVGVAPTELPLPHAASVAHSANASAAPASVERENGRMAISING